MVNKRLSSCNTFRNALQSALRAVLERWIRCWRLLRNWAAKQDSWGEFLQKCRPGTSELAATDCWVIRWMSSIRPWRKLSLCFCNGAWTQPRLTVEQKSSDFSLSWAEYVWSFLQVYSLLIAGMHLLGWSFSFMLCFLRCWYLWSMKIFPWCTIKFTKL